MGWKLWGCYDGNLQLCLDSAIKVFFLRYFANLIGISTFFVDNKVSLQCLGPDLRTF